MAGRAAQSRRAEIFPRRRCAMVDPMADDESPWCAAFVGAVLAECGLAGTGSLTARSYLKWGVPGDIAVLWRGARDGWERSTLEIVEGARVWLYRLVRARTGDHRNHWDRETGDRE